MDTYTIKEVSEMFHLPSSTLRYYEDLGILTNVERSKSGQRRILYRSRGRRVSASVYGALG